MQLDTYNIMVGAYVLYLFIHLFVFLFMLFIKAVYFKTDQEVERMTINLR